MYNTLTQLARKISADEANIPTTSAETILSNSLNVFYTVSGIVAVIVIVVAGIMYATSGGNQESTKKARNMILYTAVGLVVIFGAFAITNFVIGRL